MYVNILKSQVEEEDNIEKGEEEARELRGNQKSMASQKSREERTPVW